MWDVFELFDFSAFWHHWFVKYCLAYFKMGEELTIKINKLNKALNEVLGDSFGGLSDLKRINLYEINFCLMVMQIDEVKVVLV